MISRCALFRVVLLACATSASAQSLMEEDNPFLRPETWGGAWSSLRGLFVAPVPGVPFAANVRMESKHRRRDGTIGASYAHGMIARDGRGRIRSEMQGSVLIFDPATGVTTMLDLGAKVGRRSMIPPPRQDSAGQNEQDEDLGYATVDRVEARGTRITRDVTVSDKDGSSQPAQVTREFWYSQRLHINLQMRFANGRGDEVRIAMVGVQEGEQAASLFEVPEGYVVTDLTADP